MSSGQGSAGQQRHASRPFGYPLPTLLYLDSVKID